VSFLGEGLYISSIVYCFYYWNMKTSRKKLISGQMEEGGLVRNKDVFFGFVLEPMWIQSVLGWLVVAVVFIIKKNVFTYLSSLF